MALEHPLARDDDAGGAAAIDVDERPDLDALLDKHRTAALLDVKPRTLESWRRSGTGPAYIRISETCIRYRRRDVLEWIEQRRCAA